MNIILAFRRLLKDCAVFIFPALEQSTIYKNSYPYGKAYGLSVCYIRSRRG